MEQFQEPVLELGRKYIEIVQYNQPHLALCIHKHTKYTLTHNHVAKAQGQMLQNILLNIYTKL